MSKCEWRKLRNKYLNLQKRNMTVAKGKIRQMEAMHERNQAGANNKKSPTQGGAQEAAGDGGAEGGGPAASKELEFVPGVIVRYVVTGGQGQKSERGVQFPFQRGGGVNFSFQGGINPT